MRSTINMWRYLMLLLIALFLSYNSLAQNDYYWTGGTGNWSDAANHWATSSGGADFYSEAPTEDDNVFFDANSFNEGGQSVAIDIEEAVCHDMDWRAATNAPTFTTDPNQGYTSLTSYGSIHLNEDMTVEMEYIGLYPSDATEIFDTKNVPLGNTTLNFFCQNGGMDVFGDVHVNRMGFVNMFYDLDFNGSELHVAHEIEFRLTIYATVDLTNSKIYTKNFRLTSGMGPNAQILSSGASINIIHSGGTTQIDKSRHPLPLVENYTIAADHTIQNEAPVFDNLIIEPGVELLIHDYIEGVEFNELVAEGTSDKRISIRSTSQNVSAGLIKTTGETNVHLVDLKDITATGGAVFNAHGSKNDGNVSGWNFIKADQEIVLELEPKTYEDLNEVFVIGGNATSGLHITYSSDNEDVAVISGSDEILVVGMGTAQITATQNGDNLFNAADPVIRVFEVTKASQSIVFEQLEDTWVGEGFVSLTASSTSGLPISYEIAGPGELDGNSVTLTGTGTVQVTAFQSGDEHYFSGESQVQSFEVFKAEQTITFEEIEDIWAGEGFIDLTASSSSGLPVSYEVTGPGEITGNTLTFTGSGIIQVTAKQAGNQYYLSGESQVQPFEVFKAEQTITFEEIEDIWAGEGFIDLTASSTSGLPVSYEVTGPGEIAGNTLTFTGSGTVLVTAKQSGDEHYMAGLSQVRSFVVFKAEQTITFDGLSDAILDDGSVSLSGSCSSELPIVYTAVGPVEIDGNTVTFLDEGVVEIIANQPGNEHYLPAESVSRSFTITNPLGISKGKLDIKVFPNPVVSSLHFSGTETLHVRVFDHSGKLIKYAVVSGKFLDLRDLKSGVYTLKIESENQWATRQIIKRN